MNTFQKQLMLGNKSMAELADQDRNGVGRVTPPVKVSVEEFINQLKPHTTDVCLKSPDKRHHFHQDTIGASTVFFCTYCDKRR